MHVDGLRFDLASVLGRDYRGNVLVEPPVVEEIAEDSVLADTKLIAEPWDAAGLFPYGRHWSEWNDRYRDDVRRFWRGDAGTAGELASRVCGSADLHEASGRRPRHSINFVTCHDGFTLWDLVSYNTKHNEANGEKNRDGLSENYGWNCGTEGPTDDPAVLGLRKRQAKNLLLTLLLSQGVPMLLAGDEFLRTQGGNNNAYCQDNETSWVDWTLAERNADFLRFTRELIALRRRHPALRRRGFFRGRGSDKPPDQSRGRSPVETPQFQPVKLLRPARRRGPERAPLEEDRGLRRRAEGRAPRQVGADLPLDQPVGPAVVAVQGHPVMAVPLLDLEPGVVVHAGEQPAAGQRVEAGGGVPAGDEGALVPPAAPPPLNQNAVGDVLPGQAEKAGPEVLQPEQADARQAGPVDRFGPALMTRTHVVVLVAVLHTGLGRRGTTGRTGLGGGRAVGQGVTWAGPFGDNKPRPEAGRPRPPPPVAGVPPECPCRRPTAFGA
jgi:hypothetical protein